MARRNKQARGGEAAPSFTSSKRVRCGVGTFRADRLAALANMPEPDIDAETLTITFAPLEDIAGESSVADGDRTHDD